jgi:gamma-glutamylcyclotransferase (GGCT)/AIG2-like uncharacterized protein YtfP
MTTQYLFVYGTLKKEFNNKTSRYLVKNSEYIGKATYQGKLYMVDYYPGAIRSSNPGDIVYGELFKLKNPDIVLSALDEYEECSDKFLDPKLFLRIKDNVKTAKGEYITSWIYLYNLPVKELRQIETGNFTIYDITADKNIILPFS